MMLDVSRVHFHGFGRTYVISENIITGSRAMPLQRSARRFASDGARPGHYDVFSAAATRWS